MSTILKSIDSKKEGIDYFLRNTIKSQESFKLNRLSRDLNFIVMRSVKRSSKVKIDDETVNFLIAQKGLIDMKISALDREIY